MRKAATSVLMAVGIAAGLCLAPAHAQLARTFVSAVTGDDSSNCDRPTPCRTFQVAHDKTFDQGEVTVLDPGGYGAVRITKSISIVNDGVGQAGMLVSGGGAGITIDAPAAGYVNLRGITIQGIGGSNGIRFNSGFALTIENCVVRSHSNDGIKFLPTGSSNLAVSNTLVADNGGDGILVFPQGSGSAKAAFNRIEAYNNKGAGIDLDGVFTTGPIHATVMDSVAAGNAFAGYRALSRSASTRLLVMRSVAVNNGNGVVADGGTLRFGQSTITGNTTSWVQGGGGILRSYGDNNIDGNGDGDPVPPPTASK